MQNARTSAPRIDRAREQLGSAKDAVGDLLDVLDCPEAARSLARARELMSGDAGSLDRARGELSDALRKLGEVEQGNALSTPFFQARSRCFHEALAQFDGVVGAENR